jgi:uncharacterized damage-inducible protein DinB
MQMVLNPYADALGERDPVAVMSETSARLANVLAQLTPDEVDKPTAPGKWSVRQIFAHLADCEIVFGSRLRQPYSGQPQIQPFDQDAWARAYTLYATQQALETFTAVRLWNLTLVRGLSDADKQLPTLHPERGAGTLWTIVETMGGHDLHHLAKLEQAN